jgi:hypothetical protein
MLITVESLEHAHLATPQLSASAYGQLSIENSLKLLLWSIIFISHVITKNFPLQLRRSSKEEGLLWSRKAAKI